MNITEWLRDRKKRLYLSILVGMAASVLALGIPKSRGPLAWWGTMYPKFCFSEIPENCTDSGKEEQEKPEVKISFWLAKAFDR